MKVELIKDLGHAGEALDLKTSELTLTMPEWAAGELDSLPSHLPSIEDRRVRSSVFKESDRLVYNARRGQAGNLGPGARP